ncbi:MAG: O-acetyl-ADP-ribose deacetylase [Planctomycetota bacterium]|nr:MAG: O-acetyl-ADP-ribose deacetylase [Planctomycetota bacterium]
MPEAVSEARQIKESTIRIMRGDITDLEIDAFVFYAIENLALGSGFGTAISVRGGPAIEKELKDLAPVTVGDAVVTSAGKMKAKRIIHAVGPKFQEEDTEGKLRTTVLNSLKQADEKGIERVAFPAMGTGFYGIPIDLCARVMLETIKAYLEEKTGIKEVVICVIDSHELGSFKKQLAAT